MISVRPSIPLLFIVVCVLSCQDPQSVSADEPDKYALLLAIREYEHPDFSKLEYPEMDAKSMGEVFKTSGYKVDLLLGKSATQAKIRAALRKCKDRGGNKGVVVIGVFGHGIEFSESGRSYFCPYDSTQVAKRDADGNLLFKKDGKPVMEPEASRLISVDELLVGLGESKAFNRVLFADCCRDDPNRARGRSFGSSLGTNQLPQNAAVFFACSANERAYEHKDWGHGAFTKCLLDELSAGKSLMGSLAEQVAPEVERLTESKRSPGEPNQTPRMLSTGARIDLLLTPSNSPRKPAVPSTELAATMTNSLGMKLVLIPAGESLMGSTESKEQLEKMGLSLYKDFDNSDEFPQHRVRITKPFYMGVYEVTLGEFMQYYNADKANHKTEGEKDGKGGWGYDGKSMEQKPEYAPWNTGWNQPRDKYMNHPVVNVSWNDAVAFCEWLTARERKAGRIRNDQEYVLPSEAQWEYACRGGSKQSKLFSYGNDGQQMVRFGNVKDAEYAKQFTSPYGDPINGNDGFAFTAPVGSYEPNAFGLYDMHGNAWEWCQDVYDAKAYANRSSIAIDPLVSTGGSDRVLRGGSWYDSPVDCRSANRGRFSPDSRNDYLGFRVSLQSVR